VEMTKEQMDALEQLTYIVRPGYMSKTRVALVDGLLEVEWTGGHRYLTIRVDSSRADLWYEMYSPEQNVETRGELEHDEWWRIRRMVKWCRTGVGNAHP
jgi:hypothetical protein